jgi:histone H3/H4
MLWSLRITTISQKTRSLGLPHINKITAVIYIKMSDEYPRKVAQLVAAELLKAKGFEGVQLSSLQVLEDILLRYLKELGRKAHKNAEIARRTACNPADVMLALSSQGVSIEKLESYCRRAPDVDFAQPVSEFPIKKLVTHPQSFAEMKETPPPNVPDFFPAFPDVHSYVETDQFEPAENTANEQMKTIVQQKDEITQALVNIDERAASPGPESEEEEKAKAINHEQSEMDAREKNEFLIPPKWEKTSTDLDILLAIEKETQKKLEPAKVEVLEKDVPVELQPMGREDLSDHMLASWTWIGGLDQNIDLAKSGSKQPALYDSGEGEIVQKRQVEDLLMRNQAEEREGQVVADMEMDLEDEEI